jgi:uncharacterized protein
MMRSIPLRLTLTGFVLWFVCTGTASAQPRMPIIDMHMHARHADYMGPNPPPMCAPFLTMPRNDPALPPGAGMTFERMPPCDAPIPAATTDDQVMRDTLAVMERRNIIAMVSGEPDLMSVWRAAAPDRIIPGLDLRLGADAGTAHVGARSPSQVRELLSAGGFRILGEVMAQYEGVTPGDPRLEPYWALAEEMDVPVGIHLGPGGPGEPYFSPGYRARNSSALGLEEVLVRHPKLRVYIMHASYPLIDDLRALLFSYPHVYIDISSIVYTEPRAAFYRYLRDIVEAGYGDRIMFGSDQMIWPGVIEPSIKAIEDAPFLTRQQKRNILYNNAARFLRLSKEEIARHHAM